MRCEEGVIILENWAHRNKVIANGWENFCTMVAVFNCWKLLDFMFAPPKKSEVKGPNSFLKLDNFRLLTYCTNRETMAANSIAITIISCFFLYSLVGRGGRETLPLPLFSIPLSLHGKTCT